MEQLYHFQRDPTEVGIWPLNVHLLGNLLAVSSERGIVHVFRLGTGQQGEQGSGSV